MNQSLSMLEWTTIRRHFDSAASGFDEASVLHKRVGQEMVERLALLELAPRSILDIGCGNRWCTPLIHARFPGAQVFGVDLSFAMLSAGTSPMSSESVVGDAERLPFADQSIDLVLSNLLLPWCDALDVFTEVKRVLRPGGLITFSSCGPDTLKELRSAWATVDDSPHVHAFTDMHDLGDALLQAGFTEPVMDVEIVTLTYQTLDGLVKDLRATGAQNALSSRYRGLTGRRQGQQLNAAYESFRREDGRLPSTWEVIYGVAWQPSGQVSGDAPSSEIPVLVDR